MTTELTTPSIEEISAERSTLSQSGVNVQQRDLLKYEIGQWPKAQRFISAHMSHQFDFLVTIRAMEYRREVPEGLTAKLWSVRTQKEARQRVAHSDL